GGADSAAAAQLARPHSRIRRGEEDRPDAVRQPGQRSGLGSGPWISDRCEQRRCRTLVPGRGLSMTASGLTAIEEAVWICEATAEERITVRLVGGLAIQYLTPQFPPRCA